MGRKQSWEQWVAATGRGTGSVKGLRRMQSPQGSWSTWREAEREGEGVSVVKREVE